MMLRIAFTTLAIVLFGAVAGVFIADQAFDRSVQREVSDLAARNLAPPAPDPTVLQTLPAPVQRYLRFAVPAGRAPVRSAVLVHGGEFRTDLQGSWMPMQASEHFFTGRPAFVWHAHMRMFPGLWLVVTDTYADGQGTVNGRLMGALPIVGLAGPKVDVAALQRFLAEAPWLPTALIPSPWLRWEAMDDSHARAIIADGAIGTNVVFSFDADGRITGMETERYRDVGGKEMLTPWVGRFGDYRRFGDLMAPAYGEVSWRIEGKDYPYVRVRVTDIRYDAT
jgi:Family of unknown function (DUF6920)